MVRMTVLASGSKGNSMVVSSARTRILVDAGLSCRELMKRMTLAGEDPFMLDAILVTHEHQDHVQGVSVTARKLGIPVFFTEATHRAWMRWMVPQKRMTYADWLEQRKQEASKQAAGREAQEADDQLGISVLCDPGPPDCSDEAEETQPELGTAAADPCALPGVEYFRAGASFAVGDISVMPFTIPHDAADPVGFIFQAEGIRIGLATDLGYMPSNVCMHLKGCDVLMLESNHDLEMLRDGPYPWSVKQRVMSRVGHLSNDATAEFLQRNYDGNAAYIILAHLSESNNLPELARVAAERALQNQMSLIANKLLLASQHGPLESILF
jgi:phosphoribosyl 1,2-cyclic phosphodiesterase